MLSRHYQTKAKRAGSLVRSASCLWANSVRAALLLSLTLLPIQSAKAAVLELLPQVEVDLQGIFLRQLVKPTKNGVAAIQLAPAPLWGETRVLTRDEVAQMIAKALPTADIQLTGASEISITRQSQHFDETQLLSLLTKELQPADDAARTGELQLRLTRPWKPITVPVEELELKVIDRPASGLSPSFLVRFQLFSANEPIGTFFVSVQAQLMREVWVARTNIRRLTSLADADLIRERRDIINVKLPLWESESLDPSMHLVESVTAGNVLYARAVRQRPVVRRGELVQAIANDGPLSFSIRLEALEDGAPEDIIRARNPRTRKEMRVKVINEEMLQLMF